jgi:uncharacterized protein
MVTKDHKRYDRITLDRTRMITRDDGTMVVPAKISRTGVQAYRRGDGKTEIAYRPPTEVGRADSVQGFAMRAVVDDHPRENGSVVDATNMRRLSVGTVHNPAYKNGFIEADLHITDAATIEKVKSGKVELSAGYFMDRDETPGVTPEGERYDFVQTNIRPNHVAIVDEGRAGPECRIQLDAADAITTDFPAAVVAVHKQPGGEKPKGEAKMQLIINDVSCEVDEVTSKMLAKERSTNQELLNASRAETKAAKDQLAAKSAECDTAKDQVGKLTAEIKSLPEKLKAESTERAELIGKVAKAAPDFKCDGLDAMAIKRGVLNAAKVKMTQDSDAYVCARFDGFIENAETKNPAAQVVADALKTGKTVTADAGEVDVAAAKAKMTDDFFNPKPAAK